MLSGSGDTDLVLPTSDVVLLTCDYAPLISDSVPQVCWSDGVTFDATPPSMALASVKSQLSPANATIETAENVQRQQVGHHRRFTLDSCLCAVPCSCTRCAAWLLYALCCVLLIAAVPLTSCHSPMIATTNEWANECAIAHQDRVHLSFSGIVDPESGIEAYQVEGQHQFFHSLVDEQRPPFLPTGLSHLLTASYFLIS